MPALTFNCPFESGLIYVISDKPKMGTSTVAALSQNDTNIVMDEGCVSDPESFCASVEAEAKFLFVHKGETKAPEWVEELSKTHSLIHVDYDKLVYSERDWELMKTDHDLLNELEKLLPESSIIRLKREEIRRRYDS